MDGIICLILFKNRIITINGICSVVTVVFCIIQKANYIVTLRNDDAMLLHVRLAAPPLHIYVVDIDTKGRGGQTNVHSLGIEFARRY